MFEVYRKKNCPFGLKAIELLESKKIKYKDIIFLDKTDEENLKKKYGVSTTPQIFMDGNRIGGHSDLLSHYEISEEAKSTTYTPVIVVFGVSFLLAASTNFNMMSFMGYALVMLATLKLMNLQSFYTSFKKYDLLTKKMSFYGLAYPFIELLIGLSFISTQLLQISSVFSIVVGSISFISIIKSVYIDQIDLSCACIGGDSNVPLGFVSLSEAFMMVVMSVIIIF